MSTPGVKPSCPWLSTFFPLTLGKIPLLVALTVSTVPRFPLLLDLRVGAPYHSVSFILADEWQPIYNLAHISILGLSLGHFLGWPLILCILLFSLLHRLPVTVATCGSVGETHKGHSPWFHLGHWEELSALLCCFLPGVGCHSHIVWGIPAN